MNLTDFIVINAQSVAIDWHEMLIGTAMSGKFNINIDNVRTIQNKLYDLSGLTRDTFNLTGNEYNQKR